MEHTHTHDEHNHAHHTHNGEHHSSTHHEAKAKMMGHASALEAYLAPLFKQLPHIPTGGRKVITDIAPWVSLIFGILGLVALLSAGALGALFAPMILLAGGIHGLGFFINIILGIVAAILSILSFNPLREMKKHGWNYAFYALIIRTISLIVGLVFMYGNLEGIIGLFIGAYLLFEVREMYH